MDFNIYFCVAKMYTEQISRGQDYTVFKKCVGISILDFELFPDEEEFYSCFHIREDTRHTVYTDKLEFHVLELPKLPKELTEDSGDLLLWAKFINAEREEEFAVLAERNPDLGSAYRQLQVISQDQEKRLEYEAREKALRDYNQLMIEAEARGEAQGEARGEIKKAFSIARNMLNLNLPIDVILKSTGLSMEQIKDLK